MMMQLMVLVVGLVLVEGSTYLPFASSFDVCHKLTNCYTSWLYLEKIDIVIHFE
ncbi:Uncharacterised protein [Chlamydia trachomatis]|nr:Uncharacterised protein [Chlamydia trachomatis]